MEFRIADTLTDSLARVTGEQQTAAKTTAFDLQMNPANSGMQFHKLVRARDKNFWSIRVSRDIRIIVHRTDRSLLLCYVGHHDSAYRGACTTWPLACDPWADRRRPCPSSRRRWRCSGGSSRAYLRPQAGRQATTPTWRTA